MAKKIGEFKTYTELLGVPYKLGGRDGDGMDCYGMAMAAARIAGYDLPDFDYERLSALRPLFPFRRAAKPFEGCFAEIRKPLHCGIYVNRRDIIHICEKHGARIDRADWLGVEAFYEIIGKCV